MAYSPPAASGPTRRSHLESPGLTAFLLVVLCLLVTMAVAFMNQPNLADVVFGTFSLLCFFGFLFFTRDTEEPPN